MDVLTCNRHWRYHFPCIFLFFVSLIAKGSNAQIPADGKVSYRKVSVEKVLPFKGKPGGKDAILELHWLLDPLQKDTTWFRGYTQLFDAREYGAKKKNYVLDSVRITGSKIKFFNKKKPYQLSFGNSLIQGYDAQRSRQVLYKTSIKNYDHPYSFLLLAKDSFTTNVFTGDTVKSDKIIGVQIYRNEKLTQTILNLNEDALYSSNAAGKLLGSVKLEDFNKDGNLDLWVEYSPGSRSYDSDYVIYLYNPVSSSFNPQKYYWLKDLSLEKLQEIISPD